MSEPSANCTASLRKNVALHVQLIHTLRSAIEKNRDRRNDEYRGKTERVECVGKSACDVQDS